MSTCVRDQYHLTTKLNIQNFHYSELLFSRSIVSGVKHDQNYHRCIVVHHARSLVSEYLTQVNKVNEFPPSLCYQ